MPALIWIRVLIALLLVSSAAHADSKLELETEWTQHALRLTGESDLIRHQAITRLRKIPDIESKLLHAIEGPHRSLALDVITALERRDLVPRLIGLSSQDKDGFLHLAINALADKNNKSTLADFYKRRLSQTDLLAPSGPVKLVMLDILAHWREPIDVETLLRLQEDGFFEVQMATVAYIQVFLHSGSHAEYLSVLRKAVASTPYQVRLKAVHVLADLPAPLKIKSLALMQSCGSDRSAPVREACQRMMEGAL